VAPFVAGPSPPLYWLERKKMTDILQDGLDYLDEVRKAHLTQSVVYTRGANTVTLLATMGATKYETTNEYGITVGGEVIDFLLTAADLILASVTVEPEQGDTITVTRNAEAHIFEVLPLAAEGVWREGHA